MIYDTIITGVASKVVTTKAGKTMTLYLVTDSQGTEWTTGRRDLGNEANNMIGRAVQIQGEVKQNGNFTNIAPAERLRSYACASQKKH